MYNQFMMHGQKNIMLCVWKSVTGRTEDILRTKY